MKNRRNYYRILQVQPDAPFEIIRSSYRTLMRDLKHHPDFGGEQWNATILNEAYETLRDRHKRADYDRELFESYTKKPFSEESPYKQPLITVFCPFCKRPLAREANPDEKCPTCRSPLQSKSENALKQDSRRSVDRIKKSEKIRYYTSWPRAGQGAEMIDLSPKGIRFLCDEKLKKDTILKLSSSLLKAIGKVTNSKKKELKGKTFYAVGVQFLTVTFEEPKGSFLKASV